MKTLMMVLALAIAAVALVACGETVIDSTKTEEQLESSLNKEQGLEVTSAECPSDVEVKAGTSFTCTVTMKGGEEQTATLKIRNSDADLSLVSLSPSKGLGSNK
jgi:hypothetical protein